MAEVNKKLNGLAVQGDERLKEKGFSENRAVIKVRELIN